MLDLIVRGGDVVTPQGVARCDVAIKGEAIAAVAAPGTLAGATATRVIDAAGKIVIPGGIDPHVHMHHPWILPDGTTLTTKGPDHVGQAALWGGTTTLIDFAYWRSDRSIRAAIESRDQDFVGKSSCDWAYHLMASADPPAHHMGELAEAIQAGYPTVKIFTTNILPSRQGRMVDFGDIWEIFKVLAAHQGLGVIHAEDNDLVMHMYAKLIAEGRVGFENLAEVHNQLSEDLSFRRVIRLAERVPGTAIERRDRRCGDRRGARQGPAGLRREPASVHALFGGRLPAAKRADLPHLPLAQVEAGPEGAVGRHAVGRDQLRRH